MSKKSIKKYIEPKITRIVLDPEQAILQQCAVGGIYMASVSCVTVNTPPSVTTGTFSCTTSVKGNFSAFIAGPNNTQVGDNSTAPS